MVNKFKVTDIHQEGVAEKFDALTSQDIKRLLVKRDQFVDTGCPACHSLNVDYAFEHQGLDYRRCRACDLLYISPAPPEEMHLDYVLSSSAMTYWRENMPASMKESRRPMYQDRVAYSLSMLKRLGCSPKSTLEIGAGNGEFAEELAAVADIDQIVLLEPQELNLGLPNVEIIKGGFEELERSERTFDVVFAWELLEHILEPDHFLYLIRKVLKPGAPLIFSTPNENSIETRKLGTASSNILFDHVRLYNPKAIFELLKRNGFRIVELSTPGQLDVERLQQKLLSDPDAFKDDHALKFALSQASDGMDAFQRFIQQNLQSSHMRVVAMVDADWKGGNTPRLSNETQTGETAKPRGKINEQPTTFNAVVLPHTEDMDNPYPKKLIKHVLHDLIGIKSGKLLDLGGGSGQQALIAFQLGFDVLSVDRELASHNIPSVVCNFDVEALPIEDNSIDVVFCKSVMEHFYVRELPHIMGQVQRVLKPGGVFVILTPDWAYNTREFYKIFTHVTPYTKESLSQCLKMYGFEGVRTENLIQLPQVWESPWLGAFSKALSYMPLPRSIGKWVRWSKEQTLLGICYKPKA